MHNEYRFHNKISTTEELLYFAEQVRSQGGSVVFTNGCFDIIHRGHIHYLRASRMLGSCLVIGLNSDKSVQNLKGAERPINTSTDRGLVLEAFDFIDRIVVFDEDNPLEIINKLKPEIYTKGGDYDMQNVIGKGLGKDVVESYGGKVKIIPLIIGVSTSSLIRKLDI